MTSEGRSIGPGMIALASIAVAVAALAACATSPVQQGHEIADLWCSECHRISPDQPSGSRPGHTLPPPVAAPSFMDVAARPNVDAAYLARFLGELHLPMPTFRLSPDERSVVVAYILSLKPPT